MYNPIKKLARQTAVYGIPSIVGRFLNYLLVPLYVTVFIHTSDYGVVSELYAWVAFLMVLLTFGMETAYFKFLSEHPKDKDKIFRNSLLSVLTVNVVFFLLVVLFHKPLSSWLLYSANPEYVILLAAVVAVDAVTALPLAKLRAEEKAMRFAVIQLVGIGINIGLNLFLMLVLFKPEQQNAAVGIRFILMANLIASFTKTVLLYKDFLQLRWIWDMTLVRRMARYSWPLAVAGFAYIVNEAVDRIMLKHLLYSTKLSEWSQGEALKYAEGQVGIYSANYKLATVITIFLQAFRYAAEPFFFAQSKEKNRNLVYRKVMNYLVAILFLFFLLVSFNIDIFKYFIPNSHYWEGLKIVPILLLANIWSGVYTNQSIWYKLSGQTRFGAYIAVGGAVMTLTLNFIFIPIYGYMACAWATFLVYFCEMVASYILGQKHYPIPYDVKKFFIFSSIALVLYFIFHSLSFSSLTLTLVIRNAIILLYGAAFIMVERPKFNLMRKLKKKS